MEKKTKQELSTPKRDYFLIAKWSFVIRRPNRGSEISAAEREVVVLVIVIVLVIIIVIVVLVVLILF